MDTIRVNLKSSARPVSYGRSLLYLLPACIIWFALVYAAFFGTVGYKAYLFKDRECEIEIFAGATVPLDAEVPTEPCSTQIWQNSFFWAAFVTIPSVVVWAVYLLTAGAVWMILRERTLSSHRPVAALLLASLPIVPSVINLLFLFWRFTLTTV